MSSHIITANRLIDGAVVYFRGPGDWVTVLTEARRIAKREALAQLLEVAEADVAARRVVGVYDLTVEAADGPQPDDEPQPASMRELIRATGPSVALPA